MQHHAEPQVTRDAQGRTVTVHAFPSAELIAQDRAERAARQVSRDPFAGLPTTTDEDVW